MAAVCFFAGPAVERVQRSSSGLFTMLGAVVCFALQQAGLHYGIDAPSPVDARSGEASPY